MVQQVFEDWDTSSRQADFESYIRTRFSHSWPSFFVGWLEDLALRARLAKKENLFYGHQAVSRRAMIIIVTYTLYDMDKGKSGSDCVQDFWNAVIREEQTFGGFTFGKTLNERKGLVP